jgi:hypothetical protein
MREKDKHPNELRAAPAILPVWLPGAVYFL